MALTRITITGVLETASGQPALGRVTATLSAPLTNGDGDDRGWIVRAVIDGTGALTAAPEEYAGEYYGAEYSYPALAGGGPFILCANNDPATTPAGSFYVFELDQPRRARGNIVPPTFDAVVPFDAPGGLIDIADLVAAAILAPAPADFTPSVADVALLLGSRTIDVTGTDVGTFTSNTRPTDVQVLALCDAAVADLTSRLTLDVPDELVGEATRLAALQAATLVEQSFYAESSSTAREQYAAQYLAGSAALAAILRDVPVRLV